MLQAASNENSSLPSFMCRHSTGSPWVSFLRLNNPWVSVKWLNKKHSYKNVQVQENLVYKEIKGGSLLLHSTIGSAVEQSLAVLMVTEQRVYRGKCYNSSLNWEHYKILMAFMTIWDMATFSRFWNHAIHSCFFYIIIIIIFIFMNALISQISWMEHWPCRYF